MQNEEATVQLNKRARYGLPTHCPTQILAIDREGGPAHTVIDMFGRLFEARVSYTLASTHEDAVYALDCAELIVFGLENHTLDVLALLPALRPEVPVLAIGHHLTPINLAFCQHFGVVEVIELPRRAADLKALVVRLANCYLH